MLKFSDLKIKFSNHVLLVTYDSTTMSRLILISEFTSKNDERFWAQMYAHV